jgi:choline-sulfatase
MYQRSGVAVTIGEFATRKVANPSFGHRCIAIILVTIAISVSGCDSQSSTPPDATIKSDSAVIPQSTLVTEKPLQSEVPATTAVVSPNIVWILLDAARAENMSTFGYGRPTTPNIDRIAAEGTAFDRCYSQANATALSVPSYMTGRYFPVACLPTGSWHKLYRTPRNDEKLFPEILRQNGYLTCTITSHPWFVASRFSETLDEFTFVPPAQGGAYAGFERLNEAAFRWLEQKKDEKFFLYLHTMDTHLPHPIRSGHDQWIDKEYATHPDRSVPYSAEYKALMVGLYDGSFNYADAQVGLLIEKLKSLGLYDNTIIVVSADHGDCMGEDGMTVDHPSNVTVDQLLHVPLVIRGPGVPVGVRTQSLTQNVDIVPTLVELLHLKSEATFDGQSLLSLFRDGGVNEIHDYVVARLPKLEDTGLEWLLITGEKYRLELFSTQQGILWKLPDNLGQRVNVTSQYPDVMKEYSDYANATILPLWNSYTELPHTSPRQFTLSVNPAFASPPDSFNDKYDDKDNKWLCQYLNLVGSPTEKCPPITFALDVPSGTYRVQMEVLPYADGSAFRVLAMDDTEPKLVISTKVQYSRDVVNLGEYQVTDGIFRVTLQQGTKENRAGLSGFRFIPRDHVVAIPENQQEINEQLRSLGY